MKQLGRRTVWSVGEVTSAILRRFEDVPPVWVEAEVTNLGRRGQQVYFTLVDHDGDATLIDASMNAIVFDRLAVRPRDGSLVHAYGRVEFWRARSQVRLRVERIEPTGDGLLLARIEELKRRLAEEGLTADARKRPLPRLPRRIGLVTSGEGAARADFLRNVHLRFPGASLLVVRSLVQGDGAPAEIIRAIRHLDGVEDVDVIVVARGGGALEDLMAFNSEAVCRAVAACTTPVVSAVGHETDITVCDLVADVRVSTPTKAAEAVVPDAAEISAHLDRLQATAGRLARGAAADGARRATEAAARLIRGLRARGDVAAVHSAALEARLRSGLRSAARRAPERVDAYADALDRAIADALRRRTADLDRLAGLHELLSPARTVSRGYAIIRSRPAGRVVADAADLAADDAILIELRDGTVEADVTAGGGRDG